ncbi:GDSL-like Lipase/Acylhydrolase superfamily protein, partial [Perilla frutescens var. hirtella]
MQELIKLGAVTLMVPGNLPIGCSASYLTTFKSLNEKDYDPQTGCLNWLNRFSQHHNTLLQQELHRIRNQNPKINIIYADYYNSAMNFYRFPQKYGFGGGALPACCGGGGPYNVHSTLMCGEEGTT